jgi:hypothetical protein
LENACAFARYFSAIHGDISAYIFVPNGDSIFSEGPIESKGASQKERNEVVTPVFGNVGGLIDDFI